MRGDKVAKFLGMGKPQMYKLMSLGLLDIGVVLPGKGKNRYYIYREKIENFLGRKLTEKELAELEE